MSGMTCIASVHYCYPQSTPTTTFTGGETTQTRVRRQQGNLDHLRTGATPHHHSRHQITHNLDFRPHIKDRIRKAQLALNVLSRLAKRHRGGLSPKNLRAIYTGRVRPIAIYGAELWNRNSHTDRNRTLTEPLTRLEYQALRRITGGYNGSSYAKLGFIANIEPIQVFADSRSINWAARNIATGDPLVREALANNQWSSGHDPNYSGRTVIEEAFHKTDTHLEQLSFGDRDLSALPLSNIRNIKIFDPQDASSKTKGYWDIQLALLVKDGFNLVYTDGSGRDNHCAAAFYSDTEQGSLYLGTTSTANDAEILAIALALENQLSRDPDNITICAASMFALHTTKNLSLGHPPKSNPELRIRMALQTGQDRNVKIYLLWVRAHIGIRGNEEADKIANKESWAGDILNLPHKATAAGVRATNKRLRSQWRFETSFGHHVSTYNYQAMSAYTWMRTDRGPPKR